MEKQELGYNDDDYYYYTIIVCSLRQNIIVGAALWKGNEIDKLRQLTGLVFKTKEEAEYKLECMKAHSEYIKAIQAENKRTGFKPDFRGLQDNWSFGYQYNTGEYIKYHDFNYSSLPEYLYMERNSLNIVEKELGKETIIKALRN